MPFRETGRMEERIRMFLEYESGNCHDRDWQISLRSTDQLSERP